MNIAQMAPPAPKMVHDVRAPGPPPSPSDSLQPQIVRNMPVQNPNAPKPSGFSPVMSAESHDRPSVADHVLSQVNHAVAAQPAASTDRKQKSSKKAAAGQPKPVLETALLVTGCLVACAVVAVFFQR